MVIYTHSIYVWPLCSFTFDIRSSLVVVAPSHVYSIRFLPCWYHFSPQNSCDNENGKRGTERRERAGTRVKLYHFAVIAELVGFKH